MNAFAQLGVGLVLLAVTVTVHGAFILGTLAPLRRHLSIIRPARTLWLELVVIVGIVLGLTLVTLAEAGIWAAFLASQAALSSFWDAYYFVLVTITTLGFGDLVLGEGFRLVGGLCALTGLLTIGMTTAFLIELLRRFAQARGSQVD